MIPIGNGDMAEIIQYDICLVNLDPTIGHEIKKVRPCLVISPDDMNDHIRTVIIAPMTAKSHKYPTRVSVTLENKKGWIVLDQIRTIDRGRIIRRLGHVNANTVTAVRNVIREMLVD